MAAAPERERLCLKLQVGHESQLLSPPLRKPGAIDHTHRWTLFIRSVRGDKLDQSLLQKVAFQLHQDFPNALREIKTAPFEVTETGYAGFPVPVRITFVGSHREHNVVYDMNLSMERHSTSYKVHTFEFKDPKPVLRERLLKAGAKQRSAKPADSTHSSSNAPAAAAAKPPTVNKSKPNQFVDLFGPPISVTKKPPQVAAAVKASNTSAAASPKHQHPSSVASGSKTVKDSTAVSSGKDKDKDHHHSKSSSHHKEKERPNNSPRDRDLLKQSTKDKPHVSPKHTSTTAGHKDKPYNSPKHTTTAAGHKDKPPGASSPSSSEQPKSKASDDSLLHAQWKPKDKDRKRAHSEERKKKVKDKHREKERKKESSSVRSPHHDIKPTSASGKSVSAVGSPASVVRSSPPQLHKEQSTTTTAASTSNNHSAATQPTPGDDDEGEVKDETSGLPAALSLAGIKTSQRELNADLVKELMKALGDDPEESEQVVERYKAATQVNDLFSTGDSSPEPSSRNRSPSPAAPSPPSLSSNCAADNDDDEDSTAVPSTSKPVISQIIPPSSNGVTGSNKSSNNETSSAAVKTEKSTNEKESSNETSSVTVKSEKSTTSEKDTGSSSTGKHRSKSKKSLPPASTSGSTGKHSHEKKSSSSKTTTTDSPKHSSADRGSSSKSHKKDKEQRREENRKRKSSASSHGQVAAAETKRERDPRSSTQEEDLQAIAGAVNAIGTTALADSVAQVILQHKLPFNVDESNRYVEFELSTQDTDVLNALKPLVHSST